MNSGWTSWVARIGTVNVRIWRHVISLKVPLSKSLWCSLQWHNRNCLVDTILTKPPLFCSHSPAKKNVAYKGHFTPELEGLRDQGTMEPWNGWKTYVEFCSMKLDFASSPPQRGGSNTESRDHDNSHFHNPWFIITYLYGRDPHNRMVKN
jgi:hypothetical protein